MDSNIADPDATGIDLKPYAIIPQGPEPPDYPFEPAPDEATSQRLAPTFDQRRLAFFEFIRQNPATTSLKSPWHEIGRLAAGGHPHHGIFRAALAYIDARLDGADIPLQAILRLLYQYREHLRIDEEVLKQARHTILNFKYWPDEPGREGMCTWTESHYLLFSSAGYLAGQFYPEEIFANSGLTGKQMMERFRTRLERWMNLRFFTGFSEWLSPEPYDQNLAALLNLADFSHDHAICRQASSLIDLLLLEMAIHSFQGVFGSAHGRSDEGAKKWLGLEPTADTLKLLFGQGLFAGTDNMSAIAFAVSTRYRMPVVIYEIANDSTRPELVHRQQIGIRLEDAPFWKLQPGRSPDGRESALLLLTLEPYLHPSTANTVLNMLDAYGWWEHPAFEPLRRHKGQLKSAHLTGMLPRLCQRYIRDFSHSLREIANQYTYRTPDYLLSSAQDYLPGNAGDQHQVWQATLGPDAVCFTTHPARKHGLPPNYWTGSGSLPRVGQVKNVLFAIYRLDKYPAWVAPTELFFTHAWLPRDKFEEVIEREGWIFARLGQGYLALLSENPYEWQDYPGENQHREVIVNTRRNIWICELGRQETDGEFNDFIQRILAAQVEFHSNQDVIYHSPSQGVLEFGWKGPLIREGNLVPISEYPRFGSPYSQVEYPSEKITIQTGEHSLHLDWIEGIRRADDVV